MIQSMINRALDNRIHDRIDRGPTSSPDVVQYLSETRHPRTGLY